MAFSSKCLTNNENFRLAFGRDVLAQKKSPGMFLGS
jgi:hypothetical protein